MSAEFEAYAKTVWEVFCERRGSEFPLISPAEFDLMRRWYDQRIPVRHVAMALRLTKGNSKNLSYYGPAVIEEAKRASRAMSL